MKDVVTTFRLARQTARWRRFAAVTVDVVASPHDDAGVMVNATDNPAWRREAEMGARRALTAVPERSGFHRVLVVNIVATEADTGIGDIHEAAARAVWQALDVVPRPAYIGFSEPDLVADWLRDRLGLRVQAVTAARHWHRRQRGPDAESLIHAWLQFEKRAPVQLHGLGDALLLAVGNPYASYDMAEYGETRVGPAQTPDLLASIIGVRLTNAAVILGPSARASCAGLLLRLDATDLIIGTSGDDWVLGTDELPAAVRPYWTFQPFVHDG